MSLSPEDKERIEREEEYRQKVREKRQGKKLLQGCLGIVIFAVLFGGVCVGLGGFVRVQMLQPGRRPRPGIVRAPRGFRNCLHAFLWP